MASQDWFEKDFYKILGVEKSVSDAELKKVYRKLAREFHPDSNPGDAKAEAKFKEISEAYSVLSDADQRREYDAVRAMGGGARFAPGSGGFEDAFGGFGGGQRYTFQQGGGGFEDIFSMFGQGGFGQGGFGNSTGGFRGFGGPQPGQDINASTTLDFVTATKGDNVTLTIDGKPMTIRVPEGVADGQKIRLRGKGRPSPDGGPAGDLVISVKVRKHPVFDRDGLNLRVTVPVTFAEATMGATIEVPTLGGDPVKLKIAAGTPSGRVLRVKGRGIKTKKGHGDLLAVVQVAVPSNLSAEAEAALKTFTTALGQENPRDDLLARATE